MIFTYPAFFIALGALAIPVIIHLFNLRRYKKVYFTNVRLLQDIQFETKARSRLKHWLILLCRLLALAALVTAFTMPFFPNEHTQASELRREEVVSIYIDNSFSMSAMDEKQRLLEEAKEKARAIINAFEGNTRFQLLTNDFNAAHQHLYKKNAIEPLLEEIDISPNFRTLSAVINRQKDLLNEHPAAKRSIFLLSDFQKSMFDPSSISNDTSIDVNLLPVVASQPGNLFIDSCWFSSPIRRFGGQEKLHVRIENHSDNNYQNIPVKLYINEKQKTPATVNIAANAFEEIVLSYTNNEYGHHAGKVVLRDYPVTFDDQFYFNYLVDSVTRILAINGSGESTALNALFGTDDSFVFTNQPEKNIDFGAFANQTLIILHELKAPSSGLTQELKKFLQASGSILLFPSSEADQEEYTALLSSLGLPLLGSADTANTSVAHLNEQSELFSDVFQEIPENLNLPAVRLHYHWNRNSRQRSEKLMTLRNGDPFLEKFPVDGGNVYLFASPLDPEAGNFSKHSIFVPVLYNIALYSQPKQTLSHTIGKETMVAIPHPKRSETIYHLTGEKTDIIPELKINDQAHLLFFHDQVKQDGNYYLETEGNNIRKGIAFNYDRQESILEPYTPNELKDIVNSKGWKNFRLFEQEGDQNMASLINFIHQGKPLWKYCLILALLFLGAEILLTKLWK